MRSFCTTIFQHKNITAINFVSTVRLNESSTNDALRNWAQEVIEMFAIVKMRKKKKKKMEVHLISYSLKGLEYFGARLQNFGIYFNVQL